MGKTRRRGPKPPRPDDPDTVYWSGGVLTDYYGRHGSGRCAGLQLLQLPDGIRIAPATSRREAATSNYVYVPYEALDALIVCLSTLKLTGPGR